MNIPCHSLVKHCLQVWRTISRLPLQFWFLDHFGVLGTEEMMRGKTGADDE